MTKNPMTYSEALSRVLDIENLDYHVRDTLVALKASIDKKIRLIASLPQPRLQTKTSKMKFLRYWRMVQRELLQKLCLPFRRSTVQAIRKHLRLSVSLSSIKR